MPSINIIPSWDIEQFECEICHIRPDIDNPQSNGVELPVLLRASEIRGERMALRFYSGESFLRAVLARSPRAGRVDGQLQPA